MSIEYCHYCNWHIDTDFDVEHFIYNKDSTAIISCINEQEDIEEEVRALENPEDI